MLQVHFFNAKRKLTKTGGFGRALTRTSNLYLNVVEIQTICVFSTSMGLWWPGIEGTNISPPGKTVLPGGKMLVPSILPRPDQGRDHIAHKIGTANGIWTTLSQRTEWCPGLVIDWDRDRNWDQTQGWNYYQCGWNILHYNPQFLKYLNSYQNYFILKIYIFE